MPTTTENSNDARSSSATLESYAADVAESLDGWPWYWINTGSKGGYSASVVAAFPAKDDGEWPEPGTELEPAHEEDHNAAWEGQNGTPMYIGHRVVGGQGQGTKSVCRWIAKAHAEQVSEHEAA